MQDNKILSQEDQWITQGLEAQRGSQWEKAQKLFEDAAALAQKNQNFLSQARALYSLGSLFQTLRQYPRAKEYIAQALTLYQQVGDRKGEANAFNILASLIRFMGQPKEALTLYEKALAIQKQIGETIGEANTLSNIGAIYQLAGDFAKGREYYLRALPVHQKNGNQRSEAITLTNLGMLAIYSGQLVSSREYLEKSLLINRELKNPEGEANSLACIAAYHLAQGEYLMALQLFQQALALQIPLKNKFEELRFRSDIATVYTSMAQPEKALPIYEEFLLELENAGDIEGLTKILFALADTYSDLKKYVKSQEYFERVLKIYEKTEDKPGKAYTLHAIGCLANDEKNYEKAWHFLTKAREITLSLYGPNHTATADTLSNLAYTFFKLKRYPEALALCQQALPVHQQYQNRDSLIKTEVTNAQTLRALKRPEEALAAYRRAITLVEKMQGELGGLTAAKTATLRGYLYLYYQTIEFLHQLGRDEEAFLLLQQTKGRSLADQSGLARRDPSERFNPKEREQYGILQERAAMLNQQMIAEGVQNEPGSKKRFAALGEELEKAQVQRAIFMDQLVLRYPALARARGRKPLSSKAIGALLPPDTAIIEFLAGEENVLAFVVTRSGLRVRTLPIKTQQIGIDTGKLYRACQSTDQDTRPLVEKLTKALLGPINTLLAGKTHLVFCPDGALWSMPFALLCPQQSVSLAHSATFWQRDQSISTESILVYANPELGSQNRFEDSAILLSDRPIKTPDRPIKTPDRPIKTPDRPIKTPDRPIKTPDRPIKTPDRDMLTALPGTEAEARAIVRSFPQAIVRRGSEAQEASFVKEAGRFRVLHLASHAFLNTTTPLLSCLVLAAPAKEKNAAVSDGFLTAQEVLGLELDAELVVLSACSTAQGQTQIAEGVIGLSWAFLVAGARQLIVTQWSVNDEATAHFMDAFYIQLKAKQTPAQALKFARQALQKHPRWQHPHYWAAFTLISAAL
jgi:CHAT domain-containing protein/tetratricopeptide (TPR) repeat protein